MAKILVVNPDKCTGCRVCEIVCSLKNTGEINPATARIQVIDFEESFPVPVTCLQCELPYCAKICPVDAITREKATGIVRVSVEKCTNCKRCIIACPFGSMGFSLEENRVIKCEHCDGEPMCVAFCPTGALEYVEADSATTREKRALEAKLENLMIESQLYKQGYLAEKRRGFVMESQKSC